MNSGLGAWAKFVIGPICADSLALVMYKCDGLRSPLLDWTTQSKVCSRVLPQGRSDQPTLLSETNGRACWRPTQAVTNRCLVPPRGLRWCRWRRGCTSWPTRRSTWWSPTTGCASRRGGGCRTSRNTWAAQRSEPPREPTHGADSTDRTTTYSLVLKDLSFLH